MMYISFMNYTNENKFNKRKLSTEPVFYIYAYLDPITNVTKYIGKGKDERAFRLKRDYVVGRWIEKLKRNNLEPKIIFLHEKLIEEDAFELEKYYIELHGKATNYTGTLLNISSGGEGCSGTYNKILKTLSQETLEKYRKASTGKILSDETKKVMSEKAKSRISNRHTPVIVYGVEYPNIKDAAKSINISYTRLSYKLARGTNEDIKYKNEEEVRTRLAKRKNRTKRALKQSIHFLTNEQLSIMSKVITKDYMIKDLENDIRNLQTGNFTESLLKEMNNLEEEYKKFFNA